MKSPIQLTQDTINIIDKQLNSLGEIQIKLNSMRRELEIQKSKVIKNQDNIIRDTRTASPLKQNTPRKK